MWGVVDPTCNLKGCWAKMGAGEWRATLVKVSGRGYPLLVELGREGAQSGAPESAALRAARALLCGGGPEGADREELVVLWLGGGQALLPAQPPSPRPQKAKRGCQAHPAVGTLGPGSIPFTERAVKWLGTQLAWRGTPRQDWGHEWKSTPRSKTKTTPRDLGLRSVCWVPVPALTLRR